MWLAACVVQGTSEQLMAEYCSDGIDTTVVGTMSSGSDGLGMGVIRKEVELNSDERRYLMAVERGDVPTVQQCLRQAKVTLSSGIRCFTTESHGEAK